MKGRITIIIDENNQYVVTISYPQKSMSDIIKEIRAQGITTPVVMLNAPPSQEEKVFALPIIEDVITVVREQLNILIGG